MRLLLLGLLGVVLAGLLASELTMQPTTGDRVALLGVFAGVAALTVVVALLVPRLTRRSLRHALLGTALAAVGVAAAAVVAAAGSMFLSAHDLRLVLVALGLGVASGAVLAAAITRPLVSDLDAIRTTARRVADGDREVRTGVDRADEVGAVARAFDDMIAMLAAAEQEQRRTDEARRSFLAAVSHDLRTPLTALRGAIEALQDGVADDPERYLGAMRREVELLTSLVEDLFLLARIESGGLALTCDRLDLTELADEAIEAVGPVARRAHVDVRLEASGSVHADVSGREVGRVLRNLLDNAIRHAPDGSTVTVSVSGPGGPTLHVRDAGPGFTPDLVERAFDSFVRADSARTRAAGGAGLGLAIARGLVEAHGGTISAHPGPGGDVVVRFPPPTPTGPRAGT